MCNHFELEDYVTRRIFAFTRAFCWKETFFFYVPKFFFFVQLFVYPVTVFCLILHRESSSSSATTQCAHQSKVAHTSKSKGCACVMRIWLRFAQFITREARVIKIKRWYHNDLFERREDDWFRKCLRFVPNNDTPVSEHSKFCRCCHKTYFTSRISVLKNLVSLIPPRF